MVFRLLIFFFFTSWVQNDLFEKTNEFITLIPSSLSIINEDHLPQAVFIVQRADGFFFLNLIVKICEDIELLFR